MPSPKRASEAKWNAYQALARELGFTEMAAAPAAPVERAQVLRDWVAKGMHAEMAWYARGLEKRLDPRLVLEGARSVILLTSPYRREACELAGKKLARYACGDDYHEVLKARLDRLAAAIAADHPGVAIRAYVDTGPIAERYWAQRAGLGWVGKNGNLISRSQGSYLFLAVLLTELEVPYGQPHREFCGACRACIDACPTAAILAPGQVDSRRCISYLTIEQRGPFRAEEVPVEAQLAREETPGVIEVEDASKMRTPPPESFQNWIFGCDICQEVCPWTEKFAGDSYLPEFELRSEYKKIVRRDIQEMTQNQFSETFRKSAIKRTKLAGLQRNLDWLDS